jgi:hypothetical protein
MLFIDMDHDTWIRDVLPVVTNVRLSTEISTIPDAMVTVVGKALYQPSLFL